MKLNNKGFTVIELVLSFLFVTILSISLYQLVVNYKEKSQLESIQSELINFKTKVIIDIERDITKYFLKNMDYCTTTDATGKEKIVNKCVDLTFGNGTTKRLQILSETKKDEIKWENGGEQTFEYNVPYISYGGIKYSIPDAKYVSIVSDFMFTKTTPEDSLENKHALYKINIPIKHMDFRDTFDIEVVAAGMTNLTTGAYDPNACRYESSQSDSDLYCRYETIGQEFLIQVNDKDKYKFRLISKSSEYDENVTLIYSDSTNLGSSGFQIDRTSGNKFEGSLIKSSLQNVTKTWNAPIDIRLMTAEELSFLVNACPNYMDGAVTTLKLNSDTANSWLYPYKYWTSTSYTGNSTKDRAWYVNSNGYLQTGTVDSSYRIRPVITIHKQFILHVYPTT